MSSSRSHHDRLLESSEAPRPELTVEERKIRIINILGQIKKEKPFCDCSLYKMPLTFRSFIWSPYLDSIYDSPAKIPAKLQFLVKSAPSLNPSESSSKRRPTEISKLTFPIRKTLQRSCSEQSLNPSESPSKRKPASSSATNQIARKDAVRLNMLSSAQPVIKLKNATKFNNQNELSSHRSLKLGAVPKYLTSRKAEWARKEEERIQSLPDPDCPAGHIVMPENERLETLSRLQKSQDEMIVESNALPFSRDSLRIRTKREDLEKQLNKIEEGIRILSKPKVFIRIDK